MTHPTPDSQITGLADEMAAQAACGHKRYCVGAHEHEGGELEYEWIDWPQAFAKLLRETREAEALRCVTAFLHAPEQFNDIVREVLSTPGVGA